MHIRYATGSIREIDEERSEGKVISGGAVNVHLHISRPTTIRLINKTGWEGNLADTSSWTRALNEIFSLRFRPRLIAYLQEKKEEEGEGEVYRKAARRMARASKLFEFIIGAFNASRPPRVCNE